MSQIKVETHASGHTFFIDLVIYDSTMVRIIKEENVLWWEMRIFVTQKNFFQSLPEKDKQHTMHIIKQEFETMKQTGHDIHVFAEGTQTDLYFMQTVFQSINVDIIHPVETIFQNRWNQRNNVLKFTENKLLYGMYKQDHTVNYTRIHTLLENINSSIEELIELGYSIHGEWKDDPIEYEYYFYHRTDRKLHFIFENGTFGFIDNKKNTVFFETINKTHVKKELQTYFDSIQKQERLYHLCNKEITSYLFMILDYNIYIKEQGKDKLWKTLRTIHSFEELEKACLHLIKRETTIVIRKMGNFSIWDFLSLKIGYLNKTKEFFIADTEEQLLHLLEQEESKTQ